jgi:esterase/lipase
MELNRIIFPAPKASYTPEILAGELIWIPQLTHTDRGPIPCLWLRHELGSSKLLVYFHGNAEDIGYAYEMMDHLRNTLCVHVLCVEYPSYGLYPATISETRIKEDAENVLDYLASVVSIPHESVIVFGRSIGSGPACWIASKLNPCALVLMSAYTSIRAVVRSVAGRLSAYLVKERFRNIDLMPQVQCPTFILHGQRDKLIPYANAQRLHAAVAGLTMLNLPETMDHNDYDFFDDLALPLANFLLQCGIDVMKTPHLEAAFPIDSYVPPENLQSVSSGRMNTILTRLSR